MNKNKKITYKEISDEEVSFLIYQRKGINIIGWVALVIVTVLLLISTNTLKNNMYTFKQIDMTRDGWLAECEVLEVHDTGYLELKLNQDETRVCKRGTVTDLKRGDKVDVLLDKDMTAVALKEDIDNRMHILLKGFIEFVFGLLLLIAITLGGSSAFFKPELIGEVDRDGNEYFYSEDDTAEEDGNKSSKERITA